MIHSEVKKFWESKGKQINTYNFPSTTIWFIVSDPEYYSQGGPQPPLKQDVVCILIKAPLLDQDKIKYFFDGRVLSEEEILKFIKLKAFV